MNTTIIHGDSLEKLKDLQENSVDSICCDPPYGLSFMGKKWDYEVPSTELWEQAMRVLKPGGHLLSFAGSRTYHRMAVNIEDAGFEIRDQIMWVYGSGFPKSHNIGKAVDKLGGRTLGNEVAEMIKNKRKELGYSTIKLAEIGGFYGKTNHGGTVSNWETGNGSITPDQFNKLIDILDLKDEPIIANKRDKIEKSIVSDTSFFTNFTENGESKKEHMVTKGNSPYEGWGTALKPAHEPIVVARKPLSEKTIAKNVLEWGTGGINIDGTRVGTDEQLERVQGSNKSTSTPNAPNNGWISEPQTQGRFPANFIHSGLEEEWARYFYCAKASKKDRNEGNNHPTVKPTQLMQYLVRLVTPKGGTVLDPFMGSGSTGKACKLEGFDFIGIELDEDYCKIAEARIEHAN